MPLPLHLLHLSPPRRRHPLRCPHHPLRLPSSPQRASPHPARSGSLPPQPSGSPRPPCSATLLLLLCPSRLQLQRRLRLRQLCSRGGSLFPSLPGHCCAAQRCSCRTHACTPCCAEGLKAGCSQAQLHPAAACYTSAPALCAPSPCRGSLVLSSEGWPGLPHPGQPAPLGRHANAQGHPQALPLAFPRQDALTVPLR